MPKPWQERFETRKAKFGRGPGEVTCDLGAAEVAPLPACPTQVTIRVTLKRPNAEGLAAAAERPAVASLEERLVRELAMENCWYVGKVAVGGFEDLFFYGSALLTDDRVRPALESSARGYELEWGVDDDPEWGEYFGKLSPGRGPPSS